MVPETIFGKLLQEPVVEVDPLAIFHRYRIRAKQHYGDFHARQKGVKVQVCPIAPLGGNSKSAVIKAVQTEVDWFQVGEENHEIFSLAHDFLPIGNFMQVDFEVETAVTETLVCKLAPSELITIFNYLVEVIKPASAGVFTPHFKEAKAVN